MKNKQTVMGEFFGGKTVNVACGIFGLLRKLGLEYGEQERSGDNGYYYSVLFFIGFLSECGAQVRSYPFK